MSLALKSPFGIRSKLVFLSSFLLVIPWLGYQYILGMEDYLRRGQEQTVLGTAQALATALNERPELFNEGSYSPATREDLYVYPIYSHCLWWTLRMTGVPISSMRCFMTIVTFWQPI